MNIHYFLEGIKVHWFCLTLVGAARLWYESLTPINVDWQGIQNLFRQQYSKIGNSVRTTILHMGIFSLWWKYRDNSCICNMHKTSTYTFRIWGTTNFGSIQEHTSYKIVLGIISHRGLKTSSRNYKKNIDWRKIDSQTILIHPIYECKRQLQQKGYIWYIRWTRR